MRDKIESKSCVLLALKKQRDKFEENAKKQYKDYDNVQKEKQDLQEKSILIEKENKTF